MTKHKQLIILLFALVVLGQFSTTHAQVQVRSQVPVQSQDPQFLALPAFDLERIPPKVDEKQTGQEPTKTKVGDQLDLKVLMAELPGIKNPSQELHIEVPSGVHLQEEGWE